MKSLLTVCCLLLFHLSTTAQYFKQFTGEANFLNELREQVVNKAVGDARKENKELIDKFEEMWVELNSFTPAQEDKIYTTSTVILENKMRPLPDVREYIATVMAFVDSEQPPASFNQWHATVDAVLDMRTAKREFRGYMDFSKNLFENNTIYKSPSVEWRADNRNFTFEIEDKEPKLVFPQLNLLCLAKSSTLNIYETSGTFLPLTGDWNGDGGLVTWERAGLAKNDVYAILKDYEIKMKFSYYDADSVQFFNKNYFDEALEGSLVDKVRANVDTSNSSFPAFKSYDQRLKIDNIDENVDYEGGFSQRGSRFIASGSDEQPAFLIFFLDNKEFLRVSSLSFSIKEDRIISNNAAVHFTLHEDSIYHPGLDFKYFRAERKVDLFRSDEGLQKAPYFNSYHQIDMYCELVSWDIDQPRIIFSTIPNSSDNRAMFESDYFFRESRFDQMQGMSMNHPLVQVKNCFTEMGTDELYDAVIGKCMRVGKTELQVLLLNLTNLGLVKYNIKTGKVKSTERMYHYIASKSKNEDYDVIQISSDIGTKENASLDLIDEVFTLTVNGIDQINLSDSHNVVIYPRAGRIVMKKNRDFDFSGVIVSGKLQYFGSNFQFFYDKFSIEMPNIDSLRLAVGTGQKDSRGQERLRPITTVIEQVNGTLEIDAPDNKSGLERLQQFPIFTSHENSFAYYHRASIQNFAYDRETFFFELDPFVLDSLDDLADENLQFEGNFASSDIFPEFRETLRLQEDFSLGFVRKTPSDGFDVYRGKGRFYDEIRLSHEGLRGGGKLKYLTSTTKSDDFLFLPSNMETIASSFNVEEQFTDPQFPPITGTDVFQKWDPYENRMYASSTKQPLTFYDGNSKFKGGINIKPEGVTGGGLFTFERAELEADLFRFNFSDFQSDTSDFRLKSLDTQFEGFQFKTNNVQANVDFKTRKGEFVSNDGTSKMEFPINQYIAYMDRFSWFMDQDAIELSGGTSSKQTAGGLMQFEGSRFISTHPDQDSLEFYSPAARYDLRENIIAAKEVQFIPVADALIYPDSGKVVVKKRAKMDPLTNSKIVANAITRFHTVDSATVDIFARRRFQATGLYTYKRADGVQERIRFSTVSVDSTDQTYASGIVSEERGFMLGKQFEYKGGILMSASRKNLRFEGSTRILHECDAELPRSWFQFDAEIDPEEIFIPIESSLMNDEDEKLASSVMIDIDSALLYSAFVSPVRNERDRPLIPATGFLIYDELSNEYRISNINKLTQQELPGNYLSMHAANCNIYGEGKLGFGINPGQVKMQTVGNIKHDLKSNSIEMDVMILLDFMFLDNVIDDMGKTLAENAVGDPVDFERETYQRGLRELIGIDEADRLISQVTLTGTFRKYPQELEKTLFLTDVKLKWNPESKSYQSVGTIGVGNIQKRQVNVKMKGKVEITKGRTGDEIDIYLEGDKNTWYYFKFSRNVMQGVSSSDDFNSAISDLKADKRKMKVEKGQSPYSFMLGSKRRKDDFISKF